MNGVPAASHAAVLRHLPECASYPRVGGGPLLDEVPEPPLGDRLLAAEDVLPEQVEVVEGELRSRAPSSPSARGPSLVVELQVGAAAGKVGHLLEDERPLSVMYLPCFAKRM